VEQSLPVLQWLRAKLTPAAFGGYEVEQAPNWATAIQRHIETAAFDELRRISPDVLLSTPESAKTHIEPKSANPNTTLSEIQNVVANFLQKNAGS
jgi:hypothetical protein